mmetsp:Transcript_7732/g.27030  ORF Transcript_7732/g.27030 Transcript_7732/m.27030 type:complete len:84 (-) Transcript_7732:773-1024(-)
MRSALERAGKSEVAGEEWLTMLRKRRGPPRDFGCFATMSSGRKEIGRQGGWSCACDTIPSYSSELMISSIAAAFAKTSGELET